MVIKKSIAKFSPAGIEPLTSEPGSETKAAIFSNAVRFSDRKLLTDLADFQYQTIKELCASCLKIWRKSDQNCDRESAATRKCKMAAMTSSNWKFQKPRKMTLANISVENSQLKNQLKFTRNSRQNHKGDPPSCYEMDPLHFKWKETQKELP